MPTEREIENMMEYAERNTEEVFKSVYAELAGIAKQNVWLTPQRIPVYTEYVDMETIYSTTMNLFMGDYALFCMETSEEGADVVSAQEFDILASCVYFKIKQLLPLLKSTNARLCREIDHFLQTELGKFGEII